MILFLEYLNSYIPSEELQSPNNVVSHRNKMEWIHKNAIGTATVSARYTVQPVEQYSNRQQTRRLC